MAPASTQMMSAIPGIDPQTLLLLAYIQARQRGQQSTQPTKSPVGGLADLAKDAGGFEAAKNYFGLGGGAAASSAGGSAAFPIGTAANGGTLMSDGSVFAGSMGPLPEAAATDITNFAGSATPYLGAAGTAIGAYNAYKGIEGKNPMRAGLGGAGAALGLNAMGYALGPYGWAAMVAAPAVGALVNKMGDKDRWKTEGKRLDDLRKRGINVPQMEGDSLSGGRSRDQLVAIEEAKKARGQYSNVDFARSRNVADLKPEDIWGYSAFFDHYGNDWLGKKTEQERRDIAQKALSSGAVREHHGTIDVDWGKVDAAPNSPQTAPSSGQNIKATGGRPLRADERKAQGIDERDPNKYTIDSSGNVVGTQMGWSSGGVNNMIPVARNSNWGQQQSQAQNNNRNLSSRLNLIRRSQGGGFSSRN